MLRMKFIEHFLTIVVRMTMGMGMEMSIKYSKEKDEERRVSILYHEREDENQ